MASSERYRIELKASAAKSIERLPDRRVRQRVIERIARLAENPRPPGCVRLSGSTAYRVRQGTYRIVYEIEDERLVVIIVRVAHRRDVYRAE